MTLTSRPEIDYAPSEEKLIPLAKYQTASCGLRVTIIVEGKQDLQDDPNSFEKAKPLIRTLAESLLVRMPQETKPTTLPGRIRPRTKPTTLPGRIRPRGEPVSSAK